MRNHSRARLWLAIAIVSAPLINSMPVSSEPLTPAGAAGDLDPSFDGDGKVVTDPGYGRDIVVQPDGKTLLVGGAESDGFVLVRYSVDGSLDSTFGGDGIVAGVPGNANAVALQPDGKIVVAGNTSTGVDLSVTVARYLSDGALDPTFGDAGIVVTPVAGDDYARAVAIQPDGRIVVAGTASSGSNSNFVALRYLTDGSLDTSFAGDGIALASVSNFDEGNDMALQEDGGVVVAGSTETADGGFDFAVVRFKRNGSLDSTFGGDGIVTTSIVGFSTELGWAVAVQADGRVVLAGHSNGADNYDVALVRYLGDGALDPSFDVDGVVITDVGVGESQSEMIYDLVIQPDGKLVAVGDTDSDFLVVRYGADGSLDEEFGNDGVVITSIGYRDFAYAVAYQPEGKIVVGGQVLDVYPDFAAARFFAVAPIATTLTLSVDPDQIDLSESVNLAGAISFADGATPDGRTIHVTRTNPGGSVTELPDLYTDASGGYSTTDTPTVKGLHTYTATFVSDGSHDSATAEETVQVGTPSPSDFNGDGLSDLAVGVPWEDSGAVTDTGAMSVLYATDSGLASAGNQFWDQNGMGTGANELLDGLGFSSVSGDFNGDGFADLAAATPGKTVGGDDFAGSVNVVYGSVAGLTSSGSQQWTQDSADVEGSASPEDYFGWSVAGGDFNGDGFDDLSIGVPGETVAGKEFAGAVNVLYGSSAGLSAAGDQLWHQDSADIANKAEGSDQFGLSVGTGDFDGNGYADLSVGVPTEDLENGVDGGAVHVIYGSATGLTSADDDFWHQDATDIANKVQGNDWFGYRVAGGDFDGDGYDDLLIGVPEENLSGGANGGAVSAIYGTATGLAAAGDQFWHQDSDGINNAVDANDEFGLALATGDFDSNGYDDAAIGVVGEDTSGKTDSGGVAVIYGTSGGLDDPSDDFWHQDSSGIEDSAELLDLFGYSLMAGNFGNGPEDDLAIGAVWETVGSVDYAGAVNVIYGSPSDLTSTGDQFWNQDSTDILDLAEFDDEFGFGLAQRGGGAAGSPVQEPRASWLASPAMWLLR